MIQSFESSIRRRHVVVLKALDNSKDHVFGLSVCAQSQSSKCGASENRQCLMRGFLLGNAVPKDLARVPSAVRAP
jgi:hypothetical protein